MTWAEFESALQAVNRSKCDGIGFAFS